MNLQYASSQADKRSKGRPARISRERILQAARTIETEKISMQAIAVELGVDPTTLNYHIGGRQNLLKLAALDRIEAFVDSGAFANEHDDWMNSAIQYAWVLRDAIAALGVLAEHVTSTVDVLLPVLEPIDRLVGQMCEAGFDEDEAVRGVVMLSYIAGVSGRAVIVRQLRGREAHLEEFFERIHEQTLRLENIHSFTAWMREFRTECALVDGTDVVAHEELCDTPYTLGVRGKCLAEDLQFEFMLGVMIDGLRARLNQRSSSDSDVVC